MEISEYLIMYTIVINIPSYHEYYNPQKKIKCEFFSRILVQKIMFLTHL